MLAKSTEIAFTHWIESLLLPPGGLILLFLLCLSLRRKRMSTLLLFITLTLFYLSSIPFTQFWLYRYIQPYPAVIPKQLKAEAIVVIGGGRYLNATEYGADTISQLTLERVRYAAWLQKKTNLPILASGGRPLGGEFSEAELMTKVLREEFSAKVVWLETESRTTFEIAVHSASILAKQHINHIALVTHAYHMPRAVEVFKNSGFFVTPAPTILLDANPHDPWYANWIPGVRASYLNRLYLHEIAGRYWYRFRYLGRQ